MAKLLEEKENKLVEVQGRLKAMVAENKELKKAKKENTDERKKLKKELKCKDDTITAKENCIVSLHEKMVLLMLAR